MTWGRLEESEGKPPVDLLGWLYEAAARYGDLDDSVEVYGFVRHVFHEHDRDCPDREQWRQDVDRYAEIMRREEEGSRNG